MGYFFELSGYSVEVDGKVIATSLPSVEMAQQVEAEYRAKHHSNGNGNGNTNNNAKKETNNKKKGMFSEFGFFSP